MRVYRFDRLDGLDDLTLHDNPPRSRPNARCRDPARAAATP